MTLTFQRQFLLAAMTVVLLCPLAQAQSNESVLRLPRTVLDLGAPSERVQGTPGTLQIVDRSCRSAPLSQVRRRIVDAAVQEWAFFGFSTDAQPRLPQQDSTAPRRPFVYPRLSVSESARLASSIAGYWAATPNSDWIVQRQNAAWDEGGMGARWRDAWSAAFISWVMCEAGLGESTQFKRAIAHHTYIDQAILATESQDPVAAYRAYPPGTQPLLPGDLLCRGSRPAYRSLAERRAQLGIGARTHCDIVVNVDEIREEITVIGGNVRATVRMKILPAMRDGDQPLQAIGDNGRQLFAHLQLQAQAIEAEALHNAPSLVCTPNIATHIATIPIATPKQKPTIRC